jgi:hypothetical protein
MSEDAGDEVNVEIQIQPETVPGVFSDTVLIWHNEHGFTLDFMSQRAPDDPGLLIAARVRVPPSVIFQIARAIAQNVDQYEKRFGKISAGGPDPHSGEH